MKKPAELRKTLRLIFGYFSGYRLKLAATAALVLISSAANIGGTYLFKPLINKYIIPGDMKGLAGALSLMAVMYLIGACSTRGYNVLMAKAAQGIIHDIRKDLFNHVQKLPLGFFDTHTHGELMSNFTNDMDTLSDALNNSFTLLVQSFTMLTGTVVMLFLLNWRLSFIVIFFLIMMFIFIQYNGRKSKMFFRKQQEHLADLNGYAEEMVTGQKVEKVFNREVKDYAEFCARNEKLRTAGTKAMSYSGMTVPAVVALSYANYAISACAGAFFVLGNLMDLGSIASYLVYVRQSAMPMNQFTMTFHFLMSALSGAERIFNLLGEAGETDDGTVFTENGMWIGDGVRPVRGEISFKNVSFSYIPGRPVLTDINFTAEHGRKIALVGSTGAGKTTIINLVNRFYDVTSGAILFDGINVNDIRKDDLRRCMAFVIQDTHLFTGTVMENIRYGNPEASDEDVIAASKLANAHYFINRLPDEYNTVLHGDGANLSQGQRQLIAIARAAVAKPPLLVLDEATSSVDTRTEKLIDKGMDALMEGRTVFVIAHRLSTVRSADLILVMENGRVVERGDHESLIALKGRYYDLYTGNVELS